MRESIRRLISIHPNYRIQEAMERHVQLVNEHVARDSFGHLVRLERQFKDFSNQPPGIRNPRHLWQAGEALAAICSSQELQFYIWTNHKAKFNKDENGIDIPSMSYVQIGNPLLTTKDLTPEVATQVLIELARRKDQNLILPSTDSMKILREESNPDYIYPIFYQTKLNSNLTVITKLYEEKDKELIRFAVQINDVDGKFS